MWNLMLIGWWAVLIGAVWQVAKAGGPFPAIATFLGLWILSAQVDPLAGTVATGCAAIAIGARAERVSRRRGLAPATA